MALEHLNWLDGTDKDPVLREFVEKRSGYAEQLPIPYAPPRQVNIVSYKDDVDLDCRARITNLPDGRKIQVDFESPEHKGDPSIVYFRTTKPKFS